MEGRGITSPHLPAIQLIDFTYETLDGDDAVGEVFESSLAQ
jgi:hypothetical protein